MGQLKEEWIRISGRRRREIAPDEHQTEKIQKSGRREVFGYSASGKLASFSTGHVNKAKLKEVERYLYAPGGERVLVETVPGKKLTHSLWDGPRPIEEFHEIGHGRGKKEKGELFTRGLGGDLLETAKFTRRTGRTAHECEDDDFDDWDGDDDRKGHGDEHHHPRKPKVNHVRWIHPDFLGSTALVTNYRGRVLDRLQAGPFGELLEGNYARVKFGFTGHRLEERTGQWSAMHRQLDPRAGRWTQADPAGAVDGLNRYAYVANSPLSSVDPSGLAALLAVQGKTIRVSLTIGVRPHPSSLPQGYNWQRTADRWAWAINSFWGSEARRAKLHVDTTKTCERDWRIQFDARVVFQHGTGNNVWMTDKRWRGTSDPESRTSIGGGETSDWSVVPYGSTLGGHSVVVHEAGHLMGLRDEYSEPFKPDSYFEANSVMSWFAKGAALRSYDRHWDAVLDYHSLQLIRQRVKGWWTSGLAGVRYPDESRPPSH